MPTTTIQDQHPATPEEIWAILREMTRKQEETAKEAAARMAAIEKNIGGLSNRFGEVVEHLVAPGIMDKFNEMGLKLSRLSENNRIRDAQTKKTIAEIDIMLENPEIVIAVSVKSKAGDYDINEHIEQMEKLRQYADSRGDNRRYFGAIASAITSDSLRTRILKAGFYAVEQAGDTMRINVPADFSPRQW